MKAAVSILLDKSEVNMEKVKETYFEMSEIIIDDDKEEDYLDSMSETLKFFERDY
jgi:hypothetical protein